LTTNKQTIVGSAARRTDAMDKVTGRTRYIDDFVTPDSWFGGAIRSSVARGRIVKIKRESSFDWSQVVLVTAADLPGPNTTMMINDDHPILAEKMVNYVSEPIVLIAAPTRTMLAQALTALTVEIDPLPPVLSIEESISGSQVILGEDNVIASYSINKGNVDEAFAAADRVVTGTFRTGHQEHLYLETNGVIAVPAKEGGIEIIGSLQCPYYVHAALATGLALPPEQVIVRQAPTGGAFGGKEDYPSVIALHASVLALAAGHPVRIIYERPEDICSTTKRHPSLVHHRTGVKKDGTILAAEIDVISDGGAYTSLSPVVLSRGILHAAGVYRAPNVKITGRAVATNTPANGAFRGFGAPQTIFAIERQMDNIAAALGIDPLTLREKNLLHEGDSLPYQQILGSEGGGGELVLERVKQLSDYKSRRESMAAANQRLDSTGDSLTPRQGIGLSIFLHGAGFTGSGEEKICGKVKVRYIAQAGETGGGYLELLVSNVEMGQGASTVLPMIAAEALGLPLSMVRQHTPDTSVVPDSGPTVASRTTMIVGRIIITACRDLFDKIALHLAQKHNVEPGSIECRDAYLYSSTKKLESFDAAANSYISESGELVGLGEFDSPPGLSWDEENYQGDAYKSYSWGANVVELTVDPATFEIKLNKIIAVVEIGRAINSVLAIGQIEGGTLQAIGYGCLEEVKLKDGRYLNDRLSTYLIPTTLDTPDMEVELAEIPYPRGPYGAKGLGELPMNGAGPAIAAAAEHAIGLSANELPITPENLYKLDLEKGSKS